MTSLLEQTFSGLYDAQLKKISTYLLQAVLSKIITLLMFYKYVYCFFPLKRFSGYQAF